MSEEITTLELGTFSLMNYRIHPSVPLQLMDFYYRKTSTYMVGALLGKVESTHIDITSCYVIPLLEDEDDEEEDARTNTQLSVDTEYHRKMFELNSKNYPKEVLVGCFCDLPEMNLDAARIHQIFSSKESYFQKNSFLPNPLIVIVDPFSSKSVFDLRAYVPENMHVCKDTFGAFQQVSLNYEFGNETKNEVASLWMSRNEADKENPFGLINLDTLEDQLKETIKHIEKLQNYVKNVNEGKEKADPQVGRNIKKLLNSLPTIEQADFKNLLDKYMQDILMIMYLSNLSNSQVLISEKLSKIA